MGLQKDRSVFLPNRSALNLLDLAPEDLMGKVLTEVVPEFLDIVEQSEKADGSEAMGEMQLEIEGEIRTLMVRVVAERQDDGDIGGYVVTFDDLTEQLADQRTAAWADVARRIAHEIKNPLTPIQLSAERLKRKYLKQIEQDSEIFGQCTDTIIRQVGDLRRMVDEFSSFSRMPAAIYRETDIADVARHSVFLQEVAAPDVQFTTNFETQMQTIKCDGRLVGQALTNVLKKCR